MADACETLCPEGSPDVDTSRAKSTISTALLCLWFSCFYLTTWGHTSREFFDSESCQYVTTFQDWFFNILSAVFDSMIIFIAVFAFAYHHRGRSLIYYICAGLIFRYFLLLALLLYFVSGSQIVSTLREELDVRGYILLSLSVAGTILASWFAVSYVRTTDYSDDRDKTLGYFLGVGKKWWALLLFTFRPVVLFITELSVVLVYGLLADISSMQYWKNSLSCSCVELLSEPRNDETGLAGILTKLALVPAVWLGTSSLFLWGIDCIAKKETPARIRKIVLVFVVIPVLIIVIPIIRNRTWFF